MATRAKKRKIAPCKDRETTYEMMAKWTFREVEKVNYDLLDWLEKTLLVFRPSLSLQTPAAITSQQFLDYLSDGIALAKLASRLSLSLNDNYKRFVNVNERYAHFYKFARERAKLAEGCIFTKEELLGETFEDYKSVFYTLFKLANQARDKFDGMALEETRKIDWAELRKRREELRIKDRVFRGVHSQTLPIKKLFDGITAWTFDRVNKTNYDILKWLEGETGISFSSLPQTITPQAFLIALQNHGYENIYEYLKSSKHQWEECIFWEEELFGDTYKDYMLVFNVLCPDHIREQAISHDRNTPLPNIKTPTTNSTTDTDSFSTVRGNKSKNKFVINVITQSGTTIMLACSPLNTVEQIKEKIEQTYGIRVERQVLIYDGKRMPDSRLVDYNVQNGDYLELYFQMLGC